MRAPLRESSPQTLCEARVLPGARLVPEQRMVVADAVGHLEVIGRIERDPLVAARDSDRPNDLEVLARRVEALYARLLNQVDERRSAAVHDRHFRRVQLDNI